MIVLSLFDGMGCGITALKRAGIKVNKYYASEIDKYAMAIARKNHPEIIHLGDVSLWDFWNIEKPDLIIGGSPCQGFSFAGKQHAFNDPRSKLFFVMVDIINHYNPKYKMLENVRMKKEHQDVITDYMGCGEPIMINSALVSAQNRKRFYWCNWEVEQPEDKEIFLKDIIISGIVDRMKSYCVDANYFKGENFNQYSKKCKQQIVFEKPHGFNAGGFTDRSKFATLREATPHNYAILDGIKWRKLTPIECERLQTLPDGYADGVSNSQRYKMLGNGWTVDVISHILKVIRQEKACGKGI